MTNEECKKAREAYRFLFSMQKFLVDSVEQIMATINYNRKSGMQMFSDKISTTKPALNDCINKFGDGMWAWDYFPAYMYMYYFELEKGNYTVKFRCWANVWDSDGYHPFENTQTKYLTVDYSGTYHLYFDDVKF